MFKYLSLLLIPWLWDYYPSQVWVWGESCLSLLHRELWGIPESTSWQVSHCPSRRERHERQLLLIEMKGQSEAQIILATTDRVRQWNAGAGCSQSSTGVSQQNYPQLYHLRIGLFPLNKSCGFFFPFLPLPSLTPKESHLICRELFLKKKNPPGLTLTFANGNMM